MPDGEFLPPYDLNCVEKHLKESYLKKYTNRYYVQGRWAHLSEPNEFIESRDEANARQATCACEDVLSVHISVLCQQPCPGQTKQVT